VEEAPREIVIVAGGLCVAFYRTSYCS